ncbi:hypothetical protein SSP531S_41340 [Streptomyces spongiicola]|uniref:Uncharacterized protein n=1 Tax=Streptomyces spongiicola TaxID=1690221 RepID=A0A388T330_9ACTN|nr:hypothetical protein SSP531S_41340 [Streptomyces spongiicola]
MPVTLRFRLGNCRARHGSRGTAAWLAGAAQAEPAGLAPRAGSSARRIGFAGTGRSRLGEGMLLRLAERLDVRVRDRNTPLPGTGCPSRFGRTPLRPGDGLAASGS